MTEKNHALKIRFVSGEVMEIKSPLNSFEWDRLLKEARKEKVFITVLVDGNIRTQVNPDCIEYFEFTEAAL